MYYQNREDYDKADVAFYEIFRRHTSTDPRDASASWDHIIGTANNVPDAEDFCMALNERSSLLVEKSKGYRQIWEDFEDICPYTKQPRKGKRSTSKWVDEFRFQEALEEYRAKYDRTYYTGDRPFYMYRAVRKMPTLPRTILDPI